MFKKVLGKAAVGTAAASLVLVPGAVIAGPQFVNVDNHCDDYPNGIATSTNVELRYTVAPYGSQNHAKVTVSSGSGTPDGRARLWAANRGPWGLALNNGEANLRLPSKLKAGNTYQVRARYMGQCQHNPSSDTANYTVVKATTTVNAGVAKKKRAMFNATFQGSGGLAPQVGAARFKVVKQTANGNKTVRKARVDVAKGYAEVDFPNLGRGDYLVKAIFLPNSNNNYERGIDRTSFRVGRG